MSKVNFSRNIFLEKEELVKFQEFLQNDTNSFLFKNNTTSFGIVLQSVLIGSDFLVVAGTTGGTFKIANDAYALDSDMLLLSLRAFDNYAVTNNSLWYWVKISQRYLNIEGGTVSINSSGAVTGSGTLFTKVLRSQTTKAPIKIKFYKEDVTGTPTAVVNDGIYEVVSITNDTSLILSGSFTAESGLSYIVVGSFSLGASLTNTQKEGIYSYDNCAVSLVLETTLDTPPIAGYTANKDFYIARVRNVGGTLTIQDKRTQYWAYIGDSSILRALLSGTLNTVTLTISNGTHVIGADSAAAYALVTITNTHSALTEYDYHIAENVNMVMFDLTFIGYQPVDFKIYDSSNTLIKTVSETTHGAVIKFLAINTGSGGWIFIDGVGTKIDDINAALTASIVGINAEIVNYLRIGTQNDITQTISNGTPVVLSDSAAASVIGTITNTHTGAVELDYHIAVHRHIIYFDLVFVGYQDIVFKIYDASNVLVKTITEAAHGDSYKFLYLFDGTNWISITTEAGTSAQTYCAGNDSRLHTLGTTSGTACEGNDARLSDSRETKDVTGVTIHTKILNIGVWDMDTDGTGPAVTHGISSLTSKIRGIKILIINDASAAVYDLEGYYDYIGKVNGEFFINDTDVNLFRTATGKFDSATFTTTPTVNGVVTRGWITIQYIS